MGDVATILRELASGHPVSVSVIVFALSALAVAKILSEYVKEAWFSVFPLRNQAAKVKKLEHDYAAERAEHESAKSIAEKAIAELHARNAEVLELQRELAARKGAGERDNDPTAKAG